MLCCSSRVFILGPSHHARLAGCALSCLEKYETPLYHLTIDTQGRTMLLSLYYYCVISHLSWQLLWLHLLPLSPLGSSCGSNSCLCLLLAALVAPTLAFVSSWQLLWLQLLPLSPLGSSCGSSSCLCLPLAALVAPALAIVSSWQLLWLQLLPLSPLGSSCGSNSCLCLLLAALVAPTLAFVSYKWLL